MIFGWRGADDRVFIFADEGADVVDIIVAKSVVVVDIIIILIVERYLLRCLAAEAGEDSTADCVRGSVSVVVVDVDVVGR